MLFFDAEAAQMVKAFLVQDPGAFKKSKATK